MPLYEFVILFENLILSIHVFFGRVGTGISGYEVDKFLLYMNVCAL